MSVAIPAYNCSKTIESCVRSLNYGSSKPDEIVISYDKSTDDTLNVLRKLMSIYDNIVLVINDGPCGAASNRNNAIAHCSNDVLTHIDSDDTIGNYKLESEFEQIENGASISFCDYQIIRNYYLPSSRVNLGKFYEVLSADNLQLTDLIYRNYGVPRDLMFTRQTWELVGPFNTDLKMYEDLDFKIRLFLQKLSWSYCSVAGTNYKQLDNSLSRSDNESKNKYLDILCKQYIPETITEDKVLKQGIEKSVIDYYLTKVGFKR